MNKKGVTWTWIIIAIVGVCVACCCWWVYSIRIISKESITAAAWGQFGDSFAILNTLFSGLAVVGVFAAVIFQWNEIKNQKEESQKESFESTFFNMLNLLNEIVKGLTFKSGEKSEFYSEGRKRFTITYQGREVFIFFEDDLYEMVRNIEGPDVEKKISDSYSIFFNGDGKDLGAGSQLGHYFRTLYAFIKFVECSKLDYKNKKQYSNIIRGQLSNNELFLLFYNCLWLKSFAPFRLLVEKYAFFEHLQQDKIEFEQLALYQSSAYGDNLPEEMVAEPFNREKYNADFPTDRNFIVDEKLIY